MSEASLTEVQTPDPDPRYKTKTFMGRGGNLSESSPGGTIRRKPTGVLFQKARKRK